jgi:four helix bundle protein
LLRSGTSIGANIEEAYAAQSKNDFIAKAHIALKENQETKYRLKIMIECYPKTTDIRRGFLNDAEELSKIITQILITMKQKK